MGRSARERFGGGQIPKNSKPVFCQKTGFEFLGVFAARAHLGAYAERNLNMDWTRKFHEPFVCAALLFALTAGFGYGAYLVVARALDLRLGAWFANGRLVGALSQAHGHAQLFGWVGLLVLGMGLVFFPKLRGTNLKGITRAPFALGLLAAGIVVRSIVQPLAGFWGTNEILRALFLLSAILELVGIVLVVAMYLETVRAAKPLAPESPAFPVELFIQIIFISFSLACLINLLGAWNVFSQGKIILAPRYEQLIINLMVYGVALPTAFVFSIRALPLFLRLEIPARGVWQSLAFYYFVGLTLRVLPNFLAIVDDAVILTGRVLRANFLLVLLLDALAVMGALLMSVCILIGVWQLKLWRRRGALPDQSAFGRFDLLIYSAYLWLVSATIFDVLRVLPFVNERIDIPQDAARHALLVGFITLFLFGIAVRMLPGFSGTRGVAFPRLVIWIFALGNLAALLRVAPLFFAETEWATWALAASGIAGWGAVVGVAIVLGRTFQKREILN